MKIIARGFVVFLLIVLLISFVSASFTIGNVSNSITKTYGPEEAIKGWVNLSFTGEPATSMFESSWGSISLIDLIKKSLNSDFVYTCSPSSCASNYEATYGESSKTIELIENTSILFGFQISGEDLVTDITSILFNVTSDNSETNTFPLAIDVLGDGRYEWNAYSLGEGIGSKNYGCYSGISTGQADVTYENVYCERITLSRAPAVQIGAYVTKVYSGEDVSLRMTIKRVDGTESASCTAVVEGAKIECTPSNFPINYDGVYSICVGTTSSSDNKKYKINYEQTTPCGYTSKDTGVYKYDFEIFGQLKKFASNINFTMGDNELIDAKAKKAKIPITNLEVYVEDYLNNVYKKNCTNGCIIPVKIFSGVNQTIKIEAPYLEYTAGISTSTDQIYDIEETPALITAKFQKLIIDEAGFIVPAVYGNYTFAPAFNGNTLFSENILIEKVPIINAVTPSSTAIKYPTKFKAEVVSDSNITKYEWNFGDGTVETTTVNSDIHTYAELGKYVLTLKTTNSKGKSSSKQFNISVGPASEIVPTLMEEVSFNLANIKMQISAFSPFEQASLNSFLNLSEIEGNITVLENEVIAAGVSGLEEDYEEILGKLLEINVPAAVVQTASQGGIIFYPETDNMDLSILKEIGGGDYVSNEDGYKNAILTWEEENANIMLVFNEFFLVYDKYELPLRTFEVGVTKTGENDAYIIVRKMENMKFKEDYGQEEKDGYYYLEMGGAEKTILFSTTENVDFVNLPLFVSPSLSLLSVADWSPYEQGGALKKWVLFTIISIIIILIALIVWVILQMWYKRKYENYLFKDRNNLYNIVNFIGMEKKKGTSEGEIASKLKKAGWNSEQVSYAIKRYAGKRVGMPEIIPLDKILSLFQKKPIMKR